MRRRGPGRWGAGGATGPATLQGAKPRTPTRAAAAPRLCEAARARVPAINPATVYRNPRFLLEQRLIRAHEHDGHTTYALAGPHAAHHHLVCRDCGTEFEVPASATAAFYAQLERGSGFAVESDHLILKGRCPDCRRRAEGA